MPSPIPAPRLRLLPLATGLALLASAAAAEDRAFRAPPDATILRDDGAARLRSAPGLQRIPSGSAGPRQASLDLTIGYLGGEVANPNTGRNDAVSLRGYRDTAAPRPTGRMGALPIVAPTIRVRPLSHRWLMGAPSSSSRHSLTRSTR